MPGSAAPSTARQPRRRSPVPVRMGAEESLSAMQKRFLACVRDHPGTTIQAAATRVGVGHSTATFHLWALRKLGLVVQQREGRELRHFPEAPSRTSYLASLAADPRKRQVLAALATQAVERMTINQLARAVDLPFPFVKRLLGNLQALGLVHLDRHNFRYTIRLDPEAPAALAEVPGLGPGRRRNPEPSVAPVLVAPMPLRPDDN